LVDDVIATGGSIRASAALLRAAGAEVVVIGSLLVEGGGWRTALGADAELVRSIGQIPMFDADGAGGWRESWD
jgi:adenine phosphoribosyltransferase